MKTLAIRGATTVNHNKKEEILSETAILMEKIIKMNNLKEEDIISIIFTMTKDLDKVYPSVAVREIMGITDIPILNFEEKYIEGSLKKCIRVLIHINSDKEKNEIVHVYLNDAKNLRLDLSMRSDFNE
ncbi:chorismate mutase [Tepidibacter formicigenes]|jgi:chorismate mutase|uniref:chorismate mutase n=1 Tax=Tepidibacter formicigenes DSM 15518 TaxID=1123349 RepID=A0A1M6MA62_9FIRM|nr:chorismate mutase [Tepidibacter formicigenes]SHJ80321.1 chorismate mutase [Tepidibacter formicigenes DSM 15518]